jgi:phage shock protein A
VIPADLISNLQALIQTGAVIVSAVWAVAKISSTTKELSTEIKHLSRAVDRLDASMHEAKTEITIVRERVIKLESVFSNGRHE